MEERTFNVGDEVVWFGSKSGGAPEYNVSTPVHPLACGALGWVRGEVIVVSGTMCDVELPSGQCWHIDAGDLILASEWDALPLRARPTAEIIADYRAAIARLNTIEEQVQAMNRRLDEMDAMGRTGSTGGLVDYTENKAPRDGDIVEYRGWLEEGAPDTQGPCHVRGLVRTNPSAYDGSLVVITLNTQEREVWKLPPDAVVVERDGKKVGTAE